MTRLPKIFLIISLSAFLAAFTEAGSAVGWGILKPLSAVFFILFFITQLVAKEMRTFDQEEQLRMAQADRHSPPTASHPAKRSPHENRRHSTLATSGSR
jgi:hypothetical protein